MNTKTWTTGHDAEGHAVITHDDYGHVPAWNDSIAAQLVKLLNDGPRANAETMIVSGIDWLLLKGTENEKWQAAPTNRTMLTIEIVGDDYIGEQWIFTPSIDDPKRNTRILHGKLDEHSLRDAMIEMALRMGKPIHAKES